MRAEVRTRPQLGATDAGRSWPKMFQGARSQEAGALASRAPGAAVGQVQRS